MNLLELIRKLAKVEPSPEPKGVLKIVKTISAKKLDVAYKLDNGEIINITVSGFTEEYLGEALDLGYNRKRPAKFLWLLDQYGLSSKEYNTKYSYIPTNKDYDEPRVESYIGFQHKYTVPVHVTPGTTIGLNSDKIRSVQVVENYSGTVEIIEHKVKEE